MIDCTAFEASDERESEPDYAKQLSGLHCGIRGVTE